MIKLAAITVTIRDWKGGAGSYGYVRFWWYSILGVGWNLEAEVKADQNGVVTYSPRWAGDWKCIGYAKGKESSEAFFTVDYSYNPDPAALTVDATTDSNLYLTVATIDGDGYPIEHCKVSFYVFDFIDGVWVWLEDLSSDEAGKTYLFSAVYRSPVGDVWCKCKGVYLADESREVDFVVYPDGSPSVGFIELIVASESERPHELVVTVYDADMNLVQGAYVQIYDFLWSKTKATDSLGQTYWDGLSDGMPGMTLNVLAYRGEWQSRVVQIEVSHEAITPSKIELVLNVPREKPWWEDWMSTLQKYGGYILVGGIGLYLAGRWIGAPKITIRKNKT